VLTAYRRLHLHCAPEGTAGGQYRRRSDRMWRMSDAPRPRVEWDGLAKVPPGAQGRKQTYVSTRNIRRPSCKELVMSRKQPAERRPPRPIRGSLVGAALASS